MYKYLILFAFILGLPWQGSSSALVPTPFDKGDGWITFYDFHSQENVTVQYRGGKYYLESGLEQINHLLRCRGDGRSKPISLRLIELVDHLEDHFETGEIRIISAYRSPEYNAKLRRSGRKTARFSRHMKGEAADIRLPGVAPWRLRQYLVSLKTGGVGYYPGRGFVHVDVGPFRTW